MVAMNGQVPLCAGLLYKEGKGGKEKLGNVLGGKWDSELDRPEPHF